MPIFENSTQQKSKKIIMKNLKIFSIALLVAITSVAFAGAKVKLTSGSLAGLKGKTILVKFEYDGMAVGKFKKEEDYINKKRGEYNAKEAGKGDQWSKAWRADRANRFEPKFMELISENAKGSAITFITAGKSDYTMVVKTIFTEPGFNIGISSAPALINTISTLKNNSGNTVAVITITKATGSTFGGYDYDTGVRIAEAYALTGKRLGALFVKSNK